MDGCVTREASNLFKFAARYRCTLRGLEARVAEYKAGAQGLNKPVVFEGESRAGRQRPPLRFNLMVRYMPPAEVVRQPAIHASVIRIILLASISFSFSGL